MKRLLSLFFILITSTAFTQEKDTIPFVRHDIQLKRYFSLLAGYDFWRYHHAEIGFALNQYGVVGHHPAAWALYVSNEFKLDRDFIIGPKLGCWIGGGVSGMGLGLNVIYYTDFEDGTLRFRPEIGMGFDRFKVAYGYNIALTNREFPEINKSIISIYFLFGLKKLKTIEKDWLRT